MANPGETIIQVAAKAAILNERGEVLILREAKTGKDNTNVGRWGLPGGRYDDSKDETFWDTLNREVDEETGLKVKPIRIVHLGEWQPRIRGVQHHIFANFVLCHVTGGKLVWSEEHNDGQWIFPEDRSQYNMVEPDGTVVDSLVGLRLTERYAPLLPIDESPPGAPEPTN
jgi:ADP-ribose pyrophosphatase YjhB (NUDIX family)